MSLPFSALEVNSPVYDCRVSKSGAFLQELKAIWANIRTLPWVIQQIASVRLALPSRLLTTGVQCYIQFLYVDRYPESANPTVNHLSARGSHGFLSCSTPLCMSATCTNKAALFRQRMPPANFWTPRRRDWALGLCFFLLSLRYSPMLFCLHSFLRPTHRKALVEATLFHSGGD